MALIDDLKRNVYNYNRKVERYNEQITNVNEKLSKIEIKNLDELSVSQQNELFRITNISSISDNFKTDSGLEIPNVTINKLLSDQNKINDERKKRDERLNKIDIVQRKENDRLTREDLKFQIPEIDYSPLKISPTKIRTQTGLEGILRSLKNELYEDYYTDKQQLYKANYILSLERRFNFNDNIEHFIFDFLDKIPADYFELALARYPTVLNIPIIYDDSVEQEGSAISEIINSWNELFSYLNIGYSYDE